MIHAIGYFLVILVFVLLFTLFLLVLTLSLYVKLILETEKGVCTSNVRLDGKIALVTGGNQGIGLETARDLAARGARVVIACRDAKIAAEAVADIADTTGNNLVEFRPLDLAKFSSVRKFADDFNSSYDRLDILVNNAGCAGFNPELSEDGVDVVMQVNYFGAFLLTNLLLDKLIVSQPSRIVIVSSCLHYFARLSVDDLHKFRGFGYIGHFITYSNSKLCDVLWTKALTKRLPEGVTVNSLHPGAPGFIFTLPMAPVGFDPAGPLRFADISLRRAWNSTRRRRLGLGPDYKGIPIVYCICERLLKLCGCHQSVGLDFRVKNKPFYKSFMVYKLRKSKPI